MAHNIFGHCPRWYAAIKAFGLDPGLADSMTTTEAHHYTAKVVRGERSYSALYSFDHAPNDTDLKTLAARFAMAALKHTAPQH